MKKTGDSWKTAKKIKMSISWADPQYDIVHASIVDCNRSILSAIKGEGPAETTGTDNLKTMRLVQSAYASASSGAVITL